MLPLVPAERVAMKPGLARGLLVVAAFALMAAVTVAGSYLADRGLAPPPPASHKPLGLVFWSSFRYYLAWALWTPAIFWLSRRIPIARQRWLWPVAFHLAVPVLASAPFFAFRLMLNAALTFTSPPLHVVSAMWWRIVFTESLSIFPIYWLLLAAGSAIQLYRDDEARRVQAVELQRSLAAAELDAMRMKLQPDFLFNTLNAIGVLAQQGDTDDVVHVVDHLGTLLRLSMETGGRQFVTLGEEVRLLDAYLAIEEVRYKDRLVVVRRMDPAVGEAVVPSLILQPLVENAITHGLGRRIDATTLEISARLDGAALDLSVRDDGPGLPAGWTLAHGAGPGLSNVMERLEALYGDAGRLEVENAPGRGTIARLRLPQAVGPENTRGSGDHGAREHSDR